MPTIATFETDWISILPPNVDPVSSIELMCWKSEEIENTMVYQVLCFTQKAVSIELLIDGKFVSPNAVEALRVFNTAVETAKIAHATLFSQQ
ncbi:hypothetical protein ACTM6V_13225 [Citrobacter freundii]